MDIYLGTTDTIYRFNHYCGFDYGISYEVLAELGKNRVNIDCRYLGNKDSREFFVKKPFIIVGYYNNNVGKCNSCFYFSNKNRIVPDKKLKERLERIYGIKIPPPVGN